MKNFFEHQDDAKRASKRLVRLFAAAVAGITLILYAGGVLLLRSTESAQGKLVITWWNPEMLACVAIIVVAGVGGSALVRLWGLRGGGGAIAESLGGRIVEPATRDERERTLVNIVEEMAIASGVPVPSVYVLDNEPGINAFAAGYEVSDAAIAVTRGALLTLTRDEMQGVIAHEYSHILHGDMRLNIRLIAVIYGLSLLGSTGLFLLRGTFYGGGSNRRRSNNQGGGGFIVHLAALGFTMAAAGYIGVLAGRLIQSAVSREREFLADASAVQFTRNPDGLAGALRKIGGYEPGTWIRSSGADEMSHMFFGDGHKSSWGNLFATHPPIAERVRRLDPSFDGVFHRLEVPDGVEAGVLPHLRGVSFARSPVANTHFDAESAAVGASALVSGSRPPAPLAANPRAHQQRISAVDPARIADRVGTLTPAELDYSRELLAAIPDALREGVRAPFEAVAITYALLLDEDPDARHAQLAALKQISHPRLVSATLRWVDDIEALDPRSRLPLLELAAPALRRLSSEQYDAFRADVGALIQADDKITLFEFVVHRSLMNALDLSFGRSAPPQQKFMAVKPVKGEIAVLVSAVAIAGTSNPIQAMSAFRTGIDAVPLLGRARIDMLAAQHCGIEALGEAINTLRESSLGVRRMVLEACAYAVLSDRDVTLEEADLLRVVAESLGMPLPPFLPKAEAATDAPGETPDAPSRPGG